MSSELSRALRAAKPVRYKYPRYFIEDSPSLVLRYYRALLEMVDNKLLTRGQACLLIANTLEYSCVRAHDGLQYFVIEAGYLRIKTRSDGISFDDDWCFLVKWLNEITTEFSA